MTRSPLITGHPRGPLGAAFAPSLHRASGPPRKSAASGGGAGSRAALRHHGTWRVAQSCRRRPRRAVELRDPAPAALPRLAWDAAKSREIPSVLLAAVVAIAPLANVRYARCVRGMASSAACPRPRLDGARACRLLGAESRGAGPCYRVARTGLGVRPPAAVADATGASGPLRVVSGGIHGPGRPSHARQAPRSPAPASVRPRGARTSVSVQIANSAGNRASLRCGVHPIWRRGLEVDLTNGVGAQDGMHISGDCPPTPRDSMLSGQGTCTLHAYSPELETDLVCLEIDLVFLVSLRNKSY